MNRYAIAAALAALLGPTADAQMPPPGGTPPGGMPAPAAPAASPLPGTLIVDPVQIANPRLGFYKSGGVLVGSNGYYPYDTGAILLGGTEGLVRFTGYFAMVFPPPPGAPGTFDPSAAPP